MILPSSIKNLIHHFSSLPGIGPRQATRLVFYLLKNGNPKEFGNVLQNIKNTINNCKECFLTFEINANNTEPKCPICADSKRDRSIIAIVAEETDVYPIEKTNSYNGIYHILGGLLSPHKNIIPVNLKINELRPRLKNVQEIILALNPTTEGDATALYIKNLVRSNTDQAKIKITRLGRGMATGNELEYADEETIRNAFESRR